MLTWNSYRRYYVAEYTWAGRVVIARGSFADCLAAARREHDKGNVGSSIVVQLRDGDTDAAAACAASGLSAGGLEERPCWHTWRHQVAACCAPDSANRRLPVMIFDLQLLEAAADAASYEQALRAKYGRVYH